MRRLRRSFYARHPLVVAPELLNKIMQVGNRRGRIVEVEAYCGADDPGSHGYRGVTPRTQLMYGPPGFLYVYFTYGMHWCSNVVCGAAGECGAVLIRALKPLRGLDEMYEARPKARRHNDLCSGPAKLCQALGINGQQNGANLDQPRPEVLFADDDTPPPLRPTITTRIGLATGKGEDLPWRFVVPDSQ